MFAFITHLLAVGNAAKSVVIALKSLIFNPAMLGMAAITGIVELWQRNNAEMERAKELGDAIFEASQEGEYFHEQIMQDIKDTMEKICSYVGIARILNIVSERNKNAGFKEFKDLIMKILFNYGRQTKIFESLAVLYGCGF